MSKIQLIRVQKSQPTISTDQTQQLNDCQDADKTTKDSRKAKPQSLLRADSVPAAVQTDTAPAAPKPNKKPPRFQSLLALQGCLTRHEGQLLFLCPDSILLPVCAVDPALALWLLSQADAFDMEPMPWLVYPKSKSSGLTLHLKAKVDWLPFPVDEGRVAGKLLNADEGRLVVGVRRNLSKPAFTELSKKRMLGPDFQQFQIELIGNAPTIEVGSLVSLTVKRVGAELHLIEVEHNRE